MTPSRRTFQRGQDQDTAVDTKRQRRKLSLFQEQFHVRN